MAKATPTHINVDLPVSHLKVKTPPAKDKSKAIVAHPQGHKSGANPEVAFRIKFQIRC